MSVYRCSFRNKAGMRMAAQSIASGSDAAARDFGLSMLRMYPEIQCLEAWNGADLAFRLSRCDLYRSDVHPSAEASPR